MLRLILITIVSLFVETPCWASEMDSRTSEAVKAHDAGEFERAAQVYESLIQEGHINGHVFYNLGNAYYRLGRMGEATAAYLTAHKYLPRSPDVAANLKYARKGAVDQLEAQPPQPWWSIPAFWTSYVTTKELAYALALTVAVASVLALTGLLQQVWWKPLSISALVAAVVGIVCVYGLAVKTQLDSEWGAVVAEVAKVYSGPNESNNKMLFELHEAAPVLIEQDRRDWLQVRISDGKKGWIKRSSLKVF